ncbi:haloacid dehalogenase type II [Christiangramia sp.]|uniref:haloacid dehalogenase type II n=1 Tax=Christiangramia sp. TaxID=1931228 RepID=UPI00260E314E|nr:haloacid dehalogenase type II [Christiangramia sp.]
MKNILKTLIFDVNETLLDLTPLKQSINKSLGDEQAANIWFAELLQYALVESITNSYHDFSKIAASVLAMNARKNELNFSEERIKEILEPINKLSAYPDVKPGLIQLKNSGYQLIAFSNGKPSVLTEQLEYAGISEYFDSILSVESVKKYKPHPETYNYAVKQAGVEKQHAMMVAAHAWDITGAMRAGLKTAFILRPGKFPFPLSEKPTFEVRNIEVLASELKK